MMKTLNQMAELTRLYVGMDNVIPVDVSPFIRKFAEQLTMLEIDFAISMIGADVFPHLTRMRCGTFDAKSSAAFPKLAELTIGGLTFDIKLPIMRLPSLKKFFITPSPGRYDPDMGRGFILANAANLTSVKISMFLLRLDHAVLFPNLIKLDCRDVIVVAGCSFPALTHLTVGEPVTAEFLSSLTADQMLSLDVRLDRVRKDVLSAISKMKNLKCLKLNDEEGGETDGKLTSIFDNMHHLEKVRLFAYDRHGEQDDGMIATLANQNPKLWRVNFNQINVTDAALTSLAQLQHLTDVCLFSEKKVTSGVLTLLRGASRNVIRHFKVDPKKVDGDQVTREFSLMSEERGMTFDALPTTRALEFTLSNT